MNNVWNYVLDARKLLEYHSMKSYRYGWHKRCQKTLFWRCYITCADFRSDERFQLWESAAQWICWQVTGRFCNTELPLTLWQKKERLSVKKHTLKWIMCKNNELDDRKFLRCIWSVKIHTHECKKWGEKCLFWRGSIVRTVF